MVTGFVTSWLPAHSHIFAGRCAAGNYSRERAKVLSTDTFAAFREEGLINGEAGSRFLGLDPLTCW